MDDAAAIQGDLKKQLRNRRSRWLAHWWPVAVAETGGSEISA